MHGVQVRPLLGLFSQLPALLCAHVGQQQHQQQHQQHQQQQQRIDAALIDAGASSMQYDSAQRGFSLSHPNAPLDMRMDPTHR